MGKNLKGKECGKGICQRKDGKYSARFCGKNGVRKEKHFSTLPEARNWLADQQYNDRHNLVVANSNMTVDAWFEFWLNHLICDLAPNTRRNYQERYTHNIQPVLGTMPIAEVKPMHCKAVLNRMDTEYAGSTIRQTYITMGTMFRSAIMNDIIAKHPMDGVRYTKPVRAVDDIHFLTREEQTLTINKTLEYRHQNKCWRAGPPKTEKSYRTIPLTDRAYAVLKSCYDERESRKEADTLSQVLEYMDRRTGRTGTLVMKDLVFINYRTGEPAKNSSYDTHLYKLCDEAGIKRFCMHALRHTYATRAIEGGMQPKVLQKLLGHASIKTTMDRYVHVTDSSMADAVRLFGTLQLESA